MQTENPLLTQNNNINLLMDENITDPVSKLIETNRKAKRERMRKFGIICYENYDNLSNENKEEILNINFKLVKANNELLKLLNQTSYTLKSKSDKNWEKFITIIRDINKIIKRQYNTIEELIEINRENIKLFCKYEELQKSLEEYKNKLLKKVSQEGYILKKGKSKCNRAPSGFCKPTYISNELATFLGKSIGTEMTKLEVSREINYYIRVNNLQVGRKINCDTKLRNLLRLKPTDELSYFNLQQFLDPHFKKAETTASSNPFSRQSLW